MNGLKNLSLHCKGGHITGAFCGHVLLLIALEDRTKVIVQPLIVAGKKYVMKERTKAGNQNVWHVIACNLIHERTFFFLFFFFLAFICKIKRQFCSNTRALWDTHCLFLVICVPDLADCHLCVYVCVLARLTPAHLRSAQNKTVCLSFRDNVADWQRSSKATIRELFSAAGEQETRGGHCFHSVGLARLPCNNQQAGRLRARERRRDERRVESGSCVLTSPLYSGKKNNCKWKGIFSSLHVYNLFTLILLICISVCRLQFPNFSPALAHVHKWEAAACVMRKVSWQSPSLFAVNYSAHLWLQWHWQPSRGGGGSSSSVCLCVRWCLRN